MADEAIIAGSRSPLPGRRASFPHLDSGIAGLWLLIAICALVVLPPFFYLIKSSITVPLPGFRTALGLDNYHRVIEISGLRLWGATLGFALGPSLMAIVLGFTSALLLAPTNVPLRH